MTSVNLIEVATNTQGDFLIALNGGCHSFLLKRGYAKQVVKSYWSSLSPAYRRLQDQLGLRDERMRPLLRFIDAMVKQPFSAVSPSPFVTVWEVNLSGRD